MSKRKPKRALRSEPLVPTKARAGAGTLQPPYGKRQPCNNCPYRTDAPLAHWDVQHFIDLKQNEQAIIGKTYGCHKQDGCICVGWLMDQVKNDLPSNALRMSLAKHDPGLDYIESLSSPTPLYDSVAEMCHANYPDVFPSPDTE